MSESDILIPQTLDRLRKLADGNGVAPESIQMIDGHEAVYAISGVIRLIPRFDAQSRSYNGSVKSSGKVTILPGFVALREAADQRRTVFLKQDSWLPQAVKELQAAPGYGWGHDEARIELPDQSCVLAATENCQVCRGGGRVTCAQCQGHQQITCPQCQGNKQENCYSCYGTGEDPSNRPNPCHTCHGTRYAPCRFCHATGYLTCPTCSGHGGTPCPDCQGTGRITQEVTLTGYAEISFSLGSGHDLPSGLLQGLDRIGIDKLPKGHADIELILPDTDKPDTDKTLINLKAGLPYADIKLKLSGKTVMISAFGKRGLMLGVPAFLDQSLKPWLEHLDRAARGVAPLEHVLEARAMRDALALELSGNDAPEGLRRIYPVGLSPNVCRDIMRMMDKTLRRLTLKTRGIMALIGVALSAASFAVFLLTPLRLYLSAILPPWMDSVPDVAIPAAMITLNWLGLNHATRWALRRRFPEGKIGFNRKIGKIGYVSLVGILMSYFALLALSPHKPLWLLRVAMGG